MPLKIQTVKGVTTLKWTSRDETQSAEFRILPSMTEEEKINSLIRAAAFIGKQAGLMPETPSTPGSSTSPAASATTAMTFAMKTPLVAPPSTPTTGGMSGAAPSAPSPSPTSSLTLPSGSFSDMPSDGGPPKGSMDAKFWESMPTATVPGHLSTPQGGGWEMDVAEGWE